MDKKIWVIIIGLFITSSLISLNVFNENISLKEQLVQKEYSIYEGERISGERFDKIIDLEDRINERDLKINQLELEINEWRKTTLLIINQLNSWYASNPLVVEITHHSSSSSSLSNEDEGEIEVCELTSDDCGENQYFDASICMCIDRRPPIDEPKNNID